MPGKSGSASLGLGWPRHSCLLLHCHQSAQSGPCARHPPVLTALLTKPLPMTRQSPLRESQSLLVKWNCASWELRNRGPRVVWGQQGHSRVTTGVGCSKEHGGAGGGSHQQLLWDQLHDQLLRPLVRLPAGGEGQGGPGPQPPTCPPTGHSQVLALVYVGLAGEGPLQLRGGVRIGSALLWWEQKGSLDTARMPRPAPHRGRQDPQGRPQPDGDSQV